MNNLLTKDINIIALLGIENLPIENRAEIAESSIELVETMVLDRILDNLPEEKQEEFAILLENESDKITNFLQTYDIDVMAFISEVIEKVRKDLTDVAEEAQNEALKGELAEVGEGE